MSQITTHILDSSLGKPAEGIAIELFEFKIDQWNLIAHGVTDSDGRTPNLLTQGRILHPNSYKLKFHTAGYFENQKRDSFYPFVEVVFNVQESTAHYHVPLLLNPYGYSTYRGS